MKRSTVDILSSYIDALRPIIYINHFDFKLIDAAIAEVSEDAKAKCVEFNNALGIVDFKTKSPMLDSGNKCDLEQFLRLTMDDGFEQETFLVLKDVHGELNNPNVIALLKRVAENNIYNDSYNASVLIISEILTIPRELENYITIFDIPLPTINEIRELIHNFAKDLEINVEDDIVDDIALSFKGLNEFQIVQILNLAYQDGGDLKKDDKKLIISEKEQFIKKSGMLEIVSFSETIDDIGGLGNLKKWLRRKAQIFANLDKAIKFGVDIPKGVLIVGMPGCGKSLTAKATAALFKIPLVRLDVGQLLGKYVGESEQNMRKALKLSEAISPCVLWIDELEKAFAGVGGDGGGNDVTTRLFGQFLTWMQEKDSTVFIVATANDISKMPPEFLRKGRFDELFFVDLPNAGERRKILDIHLKKRKKWNRSIDFIALIKETEGFNGADLEAVVKDTIEEAFIEGRDEITTEDLLKIIRETKSISCTLKDKIEQIRETIEKIDIKPASMTEEEELNESLTSSSGKEQKPSVKKLDSTTYKEELNESSTLSEGEQQLSKVFGKCLEKASDSKNNENDSSPLSSTSYFKRVKEETGKEPFIMKVLKVNQYFKRIEGTILCGKVEPGDMVTMLCQSSPGCLTSFNFTIAGVVKNSSKDIITFYDLPHYNFELKHCCLLCNAEPKDIIETGNLFDIVESL